MPNFKATVRFLDIVGPDMLAARKALEDRLQAVGAGDWRLVEIIEAKPGQPRSARSRARWRSDGEVAAKIVLAGVVVWVLWFFWALTE